MLLTGWEEQGGIKGAVHSPPDSSWGLQHPKADLTQLLCRQACAARVQAGIEVLPHSQSIPGC